jgi:hypothetical protein
VETFVQTTRGGLAALKKKLRDSLPS